jgi:outer membrane protein OmpA-like peptidoglycan-associated protein
MRKALFTLTLAAFALSGASACGGAHKKITTQLDALSNKVESMGQSLEQTQERTRQNEAKIATVDTKAGAAQSAADSAKTAAGAADAKAGAANANADKANAAVDALGRKLVYSVSLSDAQGGFEFNKATLPAATMAKLDEIAAKLKADPKSGFVDIEGYTDNKGTADANQKVGYARADAVRRYLHEKHQIPLWRMNVISYGPDNPVADNKTKEGRAQNRRVEIKVWM